MELKSELIEVGRVRVEFSDLFIVDDHDSVQKIIEGLQKLRQDFEKDE